MYIKVSKANNPEDDTEIRGCLKRNPMEGMISITFETEPNYFESLSVQGNVDVFVAKAQNKVVGIGTRAVKSLYVNGNVKSVGYIGGFRIDKPYRNGKTILRGNQKMEDMDSDDPQDFYLSSIMEDNQLARNLLEKKRRGLPELHHLFDIIIYTIRPQKSMNASKCIRVLPGNTLPLETIIDFLNENGRKKQFFPHITTETFRSELMRGLNQKDLILGFDKNNNLVGVIGKWDQSKFKQTRVISYKQPLKSVRPLANIFSPFTGNPVLPKEGQVLNSFYSAFNVILNNDPSIFEEMLKVLSSSNTNYNYFNLGLAKQDPLNQAIKVPCRKNIFKIYGFRYDNDSRIFKDIDMQLPYLESAML